MKLFLLISISFHIIETDEDTAILSLCRNTHILAGREELYGDLPESWK